MPFIRFRKVKYTKDGKIASGSASIIDTTYITVNGKKRGKQKTREKLGKVIEVFSKKSGIFLSPTRGLVRYDSETDSFSKSLNKDECIQNITNKKIEKKLFPSKNVHTIFGDAYLFLEMLKKIGLLDLIKICFSRRNELERILAHQLYSLLRNESKISCEDFVNRSFFSYCINNISSGSLRSDSRFFYLMSDDKLKIKFFSNFIKLMKKEYPNFGTGCYIDSTPLPNDISSPFNALCSHGLGEASIQMRLILIIDDISLYPIWYTIIPGNIQDFNTLRQLIDDVNASLDVKIKNFVLDAGYATKELIQSFQAQKEGEEIPERRYLTRMPGKKGYPYKELYTKSKKDFSSGTYDFLREDGAYFGKKVDVKIFETDLKAYIYVDQRNALYGYINFLKNNYGDVEKMKKNEREWLKVKFGFFILISNYIKDPSEILGDYFDRTKIETAFKTDKEYLRILPLSKWSQRNVEGKIFSDIMTSIFRQRILECVKSRKWSVSSLIGKCQSLMCTFNSEANSVHVDYPSKQVKAFFKEFNIKIPEKIDLLDYLNELYYLKS